MRRTLADRCLIPLCLLTPLACEGRYVLGHAGSGGSAGTLLTSDGGSSGSSTAPGAGGRDPVAAGGDNTVSSSGGSGASGPQFSCQDAASQQFDANYMRAYAVSASVTNAVNSTLMAMTGADRASQMLGLSVGAVADYLDIQRSPDVDVPSVGTIRGYTYRDGDHGVNLDAAQKNRPDDGNNFSTVFPTTSVRAASWDLELEKRVGEAIGDETAASNNNLLAAPTMNIIRHPYWGRTQETYGEDSYQIGRMATAFTVGLQEYVTGCARHFAANNVEKNRSTQDALMNEQTLREIYGRHFEMVVQDGGIGCIMASYNKINGVKNTQNKHLLRDILKAPVAQGGFGFQGFVLSDWWAMPGDQNVPDAATATGVTKEALSAGLDVEMPWTLHYSTSTLTAAGVDQSLVTDSARRVLTQKFRFHSALTTDAWSIKQPTSTLTDGSITPNIDHEALAEEVELKSAVLLANGTPDAPVLPLTSASTQIAVVGPAQDFTLVSSTVPKSCPADSARDCDLQLRDGPGARRSRVESRQWRSRARDRTVCRHPSGRRQQPASDERQLR